MSLFATTLTSLSSSMIQPVSSWPALTPSTTTTPTPSPSSCTTKWIIGALFYSHVYPSQLPENGRRPRRRVCAAQFRSRPVFARRGVGLSIARWRGSVDAARRNARPAGGAGALGNRRRRSVQVGSFFRNHRCRADVGPFGPCRSKRPRARALVLVSLHDRRRPEPDWPHPHRAARKRSQPAPAFRLRFLPAVRAGLFRRLAPHRRGRARPGGVPRRLHLRVHLGPRPRAQARSARALHARGLPRPLRPVPLRSRSSICARRVPVDRHLG